jgi:uncharacterized protein
MKDMARTRGWGTKGRQPNAVRCAAQYYALITIGWHFHVYIIIYAKAEARLTGFECDPIKKQSNLRKHRIDFDRAKLVWDGPVFEREDARSGYGERRFIALGSVEGRVIAVVYTWRGSNRRLISARKANENEREIYHAAIARIADQP